MSGHASVASLAEAASQPNPGSPASVRAACCDAVMAHDTPSTQTLAERGLGALHGMSPAYLRVARRENRGPAYVRVGRTVRYLRRDLDAWMTRHRVETRESRVHDKAPRRGHGVGA